MKHAVPPASAKRHSYLFRLAVTCVGLLLIPCCIALFATLRHSYSEMQDSNQKYYIEATQNFSSYFRSTLGDLRTHAAQISSDSGNLNRPAYRLRTDQIARAPYYFTEASSALMSYSNTEPRLTGVYYPRQDWLITRSYKYTADTWCRDTMPELDGNARARMLAFLRADANGVFTRVFTLFPESNSGREKLIVAVPVRLGQNSAQSTAVMLYTLQPSSFNTSFFFSATAAKMEFDVYRRETGELLMRAGEPLLSSGDRAAVGENLPMIGQTDIRTISSANGTPCTIFLSADSTGQYVFASVAPQDAVERSNRKYYHTMQMVLLGVMGLLALLAASLIYINYKPIHQLARKVGTSSGKGELGDISGMIDNMTNELTEQNMLIKDYLMENILYGKPICDADLRRLGVSDHTGCYRVYTLTGAPLNSDERAAVVAEVLAKFGVSMFLTDITQHRQTVFTCLLPVTGPTGLTEFLRDWVVRRRPHDPFVAGEKVATLSALRDSYLSCNPEPAAAPAGTPCAEPDRPAKLDSEALAQQVLVYLQEHFRDQDISQTVVADEFSISTYSLSRMFKNHFGLGFAEYIAGRRIEYAKQQLLTTDRSVAEIAESCGLPNVNYFSRLFTATVGPTPGKFRSGNTEQ